MSYLVIPDNYNIIFIVMTLNQRNPEQTAAMWIWVKGVCDMPNVYPYSDM